MHRVYTRAMHASTSPLDQWMKMYARSQTTLVHSSLARPWGFRLDPGASVAFHLVWKGSAWLRPANELPLQLSERDLVVVGDGQAHELTDTSDGVALPLREFMQLPPAPKEEVETVIFCGRFRISGTRSALGLAALPALLHIPAHELAGQAGVSAVVSLLAGELQAGTAGQETLMESLGESLLIYVLRCAAERAGHSTGWLPAMQDPYLARVFRAIHAEPAGNWTVESMARQAGLSRAAFARRFSARVGETPQGYLRAWRLILAARRLSAGRVPLSVLAVEAGYQSEAAFTRAFKAFHGTPPSAFPRET